MTLKQLERFIRIRNQSGYCSNLQFSIDAEEAGFDAKDLGAAVKREAGGYRWETQHGVLLERHGSMELVPIGESEPLD